MSKNIYDSKLSAENIIAREHISNVIAIIMPLLLLWLMYNNNAPKPNIALSTAINHSPGLSLIDFIFFIFCS